jgi:hypothetical protein
MKSDPDFQMKFLRNFSIGELRDGCGSELCFAKLRPFLETERL